MASMLASLPKRDPILFAGLVATLMLGAAYGFQIIGGLYPCELCWWQRYPYIAAMAVALIGKAVTVLPRALVILILAALFLTDAGIAAFHVGVEQRWWEGLATCSGYVNITDNINDSLKAIMEAPLIRCDEIAWSLFGISMAGYNFLIATATGLWLLGRVRKA
jgi:disulfide bond formation protein DsbB